MCLRLCLRCCCSIPVLLFFTAIVWLCVLSLEQPRRRAPAQAPPGLRALSGQAAGAAAGSPASLRSGVPIYVPVWEPPPSPLDLELFLLAGSKDVAGTAAVPSFATAPQPSREEAVRALVAAGADVNYRSATWSTPLHRAAAAGYLGVLQALVAAGADANAVDVYGASVTTVAAREGRVEVLRELLRLGVDINGPHVISDSSDALMRASRRGHAECAELLLGAGALVNTRDKQGRTPLMYAVQDNKVGIVKLLLEHKASFRDRSADGVSATSWAAHYNRDEIIGLLNALGAGIEKGVVYY